MRKVKEILYCAVLFPISVLSQELDLFNQIETDELKQSKLLPDKMIFTQRFLWGEKGFYLGLPIAIGIGLYGRAYFIVHDIFIHK